MDQRIVPGVTAMEKRQIWPGSTQLAPVPAVLLGVGGAAGYRANLITVAWAGIACSKPPMLSVAIRPERHSYEILCATGEFSVNIPTAALAETVDWCGVVSGRDHDKFAERQLTQLAGTQIAAPLVAECPVALECRVRQKLELGSHHLFLADILAVQVLESWLTAAGRLDLAKEGLLAYAHGHYYNLGECLGHFGYSIRKKPGDKVRR